ncbi:MAG: hypothetical protein ABI402_05800 [Ferruginibacter sp.]
MKNPLFISIALMAVLFTSCNKHDDAVVPVSTNTVNNTVVSGTWRITYFWDNDQDETANYSGYAFTFGGGAVLTAGNGTSSVTGTWTSGTDDSTVKLIISFSTPSSFVDLSDDWHVLSRTDTKITLQDVSGGNGGTDFLTFEKN